MATAAVNAATGGGTGSEPVGEGRMPLVEHLRELRNRLFKSVAAIIAMMVVAWIYYDPLFALLTEPFMSSIQALAAERDIDATLTLAGPADPFTLQIKIALVGGVVLSSPVWLYQLWAFVVPGLHRQERRWSMVFGAIAGPLFIAGVLLGFLILPKAIEILISFTPADVSNLVQVDRYLSFVLRMLLVFGIAFEIPLFVVLLNLAGVVSSASLARYRAWIVIGTFVFAAVATPSTDPITMLFLALPMTGLFLVSELIARLVDRSRRRRSGEPDYAALSDDETSALALPRDPDDERPSSLQEPD
ncbi:MAG TPA: twin-arginine translocase subunit TatC [Nocardioidaceae bacterium]|nr:twin-arginine translocase subunit TatC [Nocardioidaceae bacterium]